MMIMMINDDQYDTIALVVSQQQRMMMNQHERHHRRLIVPIRLILIAIAIAIIIGLFIMDGSFNTMDDHRTVRLSHQRSSSSSSSSSSLLFVLANPSSTGAASSVHYLTSIVTLIVNPLPRSSATMIPSFDPNTYSYSVSCSSSTIGISMLIATTSPATMSMRGPITYYAPTPLALTGVGGCTPSATFGPGCLSVPRSLDGGVNVFTVNSTIGSSFIIYTISVLRYPGYFAWSPNSPFIYSNSGLQLQLSTLVVAGYSGFGSSPDISLTINMYAVESAAMLVMTGDDAGTGAVLPTTSTPVASPGSFSEGATWTFLAPAYLTPASDTLGEPITVTIAVSGTNANLFDAVPIIMITLKRQSLISWSFQTAGLAPPTHVFANVNSMLNINIDEMPTNGSSVSIAVSCASASAVISGSPLLFDNTDGNMVSSAQSQGFVVAFALTSAISAGYAPSWVLASFGLTPSGSDATHFLPNNGNSLLVLPQATITHVGLPTMNLYQNEVINIATNINYGAYGWITLTLTWSFDSPAQSGSWPSMISPSSYTWSTASSSVTPWLDPSLYNSVHPCDTTQASYTCQSAPPSYYWTITVPNLSQSDWITITSTVIGEDVLHYIAPSPVRYFVLVRSLTSVIPIINAPTSQYVATMIPTFNPNVYAYTITVSSSTKSMSLLIATTTPSTIAMQTPINSYPPVQLRTTGSTNCVTSTFGAGCISVARLLDGGSNMFSVNSSTDGIFTISVLRLPGSLTMTYSPIIFSTQSGFVNILMGVVSGYTSFGDTPNISVDIAMVGLESAAMRAISGDPAGTVVTPIPHSPTNVQSLTTASNSTTWTLTAPSYVTPVSDTIGELYNVTMIISGSDSSMFDTIPSFIITLRRQSIISFSYTLGGVPPTYMFANIVTMMYFNFDELPTIGTLLTIDLHSGDATLTGWPFHFDNTIGNMVATDQSQSFVATVPLTTAISAGYASTVAGQSWVAASFTFTAGDTDAAHYAPSTYSVLVIPLATITHVGLPSTTTNLFAGDTFSIVTSINYGPFSDIMIVMSWRFDNVTQSGVHSSMIAPVSYTWYTTSTSATPYIDPSLYNSVHPCDTTQESYRCAPIPPSFTWSIAVPIIPSSDYFTISFIVTGIDALHYITPSSIRYFVNVPQLTNILIIAVSPLPQYLLTMSPIFEPNIYTYAVTCSSATKSISLLIATTVPASMTMQGPITTYASVQLNVTSSKGCATSIFGPGCMSAPRFLDGGYNTFNVTSSSTTFVIVILRLPGVFTLAYSPIIYSTQYSYVNLTVGMVSGYTGFSSSPAIDLTMTTTGVESAAMMAITGDAAGTPVVMPFTPTVTISPSSFGTTRWMLSAPSYVTPLGDIGEVFNVSIAISGANSQMFDTLSSFIITLRRQSIVSWSSSVGGTAIRYIFGTYLKTIYVNIDEIPSSGTCVSIAVSISIAVTGEVGNPLTYNNTNGAMTATMQWQSFQAMPSIAAGITAGYANDITALSWYTATFVFAVSGTDAAHYASPTSIGTLIIPRAKLTNIGLPATTNVYQGQIINVVSNINYGTLSSITLSMTWTFDNVTQSGVHSTMVSPSSYTWSTTSTSTETYLDPSLYNSVHPCNDTMKNYTCALMPQFAWILTVPMLTKSDFFTITPSLTGADGSHFINPSTVRYLVAVRYLTSIAFLVLAPTPEYVPTMTPKFDLNVYNYTISVPSATTSICLLVATTGATTMGMRGPIAYYSARQLNLTTQSTCVLSSYGAGCTSVRRLLDGGRNVFNVTSLLDFSWYIITVLRLPGAFTLTYPTVMYPYSTSFINLALTFVTGYTSFSDTPDIAVDITISGYESAAMRAITGDPANSIDTVLTIPSSATQNPSFTTAAGWTIATGNYLTPVSDTIGEMYNITILVSGSDSPMFDAILPFSINVRRHAVTTWTNTLGVIPMYLFANVATTIFLHIDEPPVYNSSLKVTFAIYSSTTTMITPTSLTYSTPLGVITAASQSQSFVMTTGLTSAISAGYATSVPGAQSWTKIEVDFVSGGPDAAHYQTYGFFPLVIPLATITSVGLPASKTINSSTVFNLTSSINYGTFGSVTLTMTWAFDKPSVSGTWPTLVSPSSYTWTTSSNSSLPHLDPSLFNSAVPCNSTGQSYSCAPAPITFNWTIAIPKLLRADNISITTNLTGRDSKHYATPSVYRYVVLASPSLSSSSTGAHRSSSSSSAKVVVNINLKNITNISLIVIQPRPQSKLLLTPMFVSSVRSYSATVPSATTTISLLIANTKASTITMVGPITTYSSINLDLTGSATCITSTFGPGCLSRARVIDAGYNVFTINSTVDGFVTISVLRLAGYFTLTTLPTILYSNQVFVFTLSIGIIAGYTGFSTSPNIGITLAIVGIESAAMRAITGDVVSTSAILPFSPTSTTYPASFTSTVTWTITSPSYVTPVSDVLGEVFIANITLIGTTTPSQTYLFDTIPSFAITLRRQSLISLSTSIPAFIFTQQFLSITMFIDEICSNFTNLALYISADVAGVSPYSLIFSGAVQYQSFVVTFPLTSAIAATYANGVGEQSWYLASVVFATSGSDINHYIAPSSIPILVIPQSSFTSIGLPSMTIASLYAGAVLSVLTSINYGPFANVTLTLNWAFDNPMQSGTYPSLVSQSSYTWTTASTSATPYLDPTLYSSTTPCDTQQAYVCKPTPASFNWILTLPNLVQSDYITINSTVSGPDSLHFITPSMIRYLVSGQSLIIISADLPSSAVIGASYGFYVSVNSAPFGQYVSVELTDNTISNEAGFVCTPPQPIIFTRSNFATPVFCTYTAPLLAQTLTINRTNPLSDTGVDAQYMMSSVTIIVVGILYIPSALPIWLYTNQILAGFSSTLLGYVNAPPYPDLRWSYNVTSIAGVAVPLVSPSRVDFSKGAGMTQYLTLTAPSIVPSPLIAPGSINSPPYSTDPAGTLIISYIFSGALLSALQIPYALTPFNLSIVSQATMTITGMPAFMYTNEQTTISVSISAPTTPCSPSSINGQLVTDCSPSTSSSLATLFSGNSSSAFCCLASCGVAGTSGACLQLLLVPIQCVQDGSTGVVPPVCSGSAPIASAYSGSFAIQNPNQSPYVSSQDAYGNNWITWAPGSSDNQRTLTFTAPSTAGNLSIGINVFGDSSHYILPSAFSMAIYGQAGFTISGLSVVISPTSGLYTMPVSTSVVLSIIVGAQPVLYGNVSLHIYAMNGGSVDQSTIMFTWLNWASSQTVTYTASAIPMTSKLEFGVSSLSGVTNANQFNAPSSIAITVQGTYALANAPTYLYQNQVWSPTVLTTAGLANPGLLVSMIVSPIGGVTISPSSFSLSNTMTQAFVVSGPANMTIAGALISIVTVSFTVSGVDEYLYPNPATSTVLHMSITILPQASITLINVPATMLVSTALILLLRFVINTADSNPLNYLPLDPAGPLAAAATALGVTSAATIMLSILSTCDISVCTDLPDSFTGGSSISFVIGGSLYIDVPFTAPAESMKLTIAYAFDYGIVGSNPWQYTLPPSVTIKINPMGSWAINIPPFLYSLSQSTFNFLPSLVPASGIYISINPSDGYLLNPGQQSISDNEFAFQQGTTIPGSIDYIAPEVLVGAEAVTFVFNSLGSTDIAARQLLAPANIIVAVVTNGDFRLSGIPVSVMPLAPFTIQAQWRNVKVGQTTQLNISSFDQTSIPSTGLYFSDQTWKTFYLRAPLAASLLVMNLQATLGVAPGPTSTYILGNVDVSGMMTVLYSNQTSTMISLTPAIVILEASPLSINLYATIPSSSSVADGVDTITPAAQLYENNAFQTFFIIAPTTTTVNTSIYISFVLSGVAGMQFALMHVYPILLLMQEQFVFTLLTSLNVHAFELATYSVTLSAAPTLGMFVYLCIGIQPYSPRPFGTSGTLISTSFVMPIECTGAPALNFTNDYDNADGTNGMQTYIFSYEAPIDTVSITLVYLAIGSDFAHFIQPPPSDEIVGGGSYLFIPCGSVNSVLVSGSPDYLVPTIGSSPYFTSYPLINGLYFIGAPLFASPHYFMDVTTGASMIGQPTVHLFFLPVNALNASVWPWPTVATQGINGTWLIDIDTSAYVGVGLHVTAFYSNAVYPVDTDATWTSVATGATSSTMIVTCEVDCSQLGTTKSLEVAVCFTGIALPPLLSTAPVTYPAYSSCPLSCGHYVSGIIAVCAPISFNKPLTKAEALPISAIGIDSSTITYWTTNIYSPMIIIQLSCVLCSYARTISVVRTCGGSVTDSDVALDLLFQLSMPLICTSACMSVWNPFYLDCIGVNAAAVPISIAAFANSCAGPGAPASIMSINVVGVTSNTIILSWPQPNTPGNALFAKIYTVQRCVASTSKCSMMNVTTNAYTDTSLTPSTSYTYRVLSGNTYSMGTLWSVNITASTLPASLVAVACGSLAASTIVWSRQIVPIGSPPLLSVQVTWKWNALYNYKMMTFATLMSRTQTDPFKPVASRYAQAWVGNGTNITADATGILIASVMLTSIAPDSYFANVLMCQPSSIPLAAWSPFPLLMPTAIKSPFGPIVQPTFVQPQASTITSTSVHLYWLPVYNGIMCGGSNLDTYAAACKGYTYQISQLNVATLELTIVQLVYPLAFGIVLNNDFPILFLQPNTAYTFSICLHLAILPCSTSSSVTIITSDSTPITNAEPDFEYVTAYIATASWNASDYYTTSYTMIDMYHFQLASVSSPSGVASTAPQVDYYILSSALSDPTSYNFLLGGLVPTTSYRVQWRVHSSQGGWSIFPDPRAVDDGTPSIIMPDASPMIISMIAEDPSFTHTEFAIVDLIVITFDRDTNKNGALADESGVDQMFAWSSAIPSSYAGTWTTPRVITIVILGLTPPPAPSPPVVGQFTATLIGSLYSASIYGIANPFDAAGSTSATLTGSWGDAAHVYLTSTQDTFDIKQDSLDTPLPLFARLNMKNLTLLYDHTLVNLQITAVNGFISYPYAEFIANPYWQRLRLTQVTVNLVKLSDIYGTIDAGAMMPTGTGSILMKFGYSPSVMYVGSDAITLAVINCKTGAVIDTVQLSLRINRINHAPTITVSSTPMQLIGSMPFCFTPDVVSIVDIDDSTFTLVSVSLSALYSLTGAFTLTSPLPDGMASSFFNNIGIAAPWVTLTGPLGLIAASLSLITFADTIAGANPDWPTPVGINVHVQDFGIEGLVSPTATQPAGVDAVITFTPLCNINSATLMATVNYSGPLQPPAPVFLSAVLSTNLASMILTFDLPIHTPNMSYSPAFHSGYPLPNSAIAPVHNFFNNVLYRLPVYFNASYCTKANGGVYTYAFDDPNQSANFTALCRNVLYHNYTYVRPAMMPFYDILPRALNASVWPSRYAFVPQKQFDNTCADMLSPSIIAMLGDVGTFSCVFTQSNVLTVSLGAAASLSVGTMITLNTGMFKPCALSPISIISANAASVILVGPSVAYIPIVTIGGPTTLSLCEDLILDSYTNDISLLSSVQWSTTSDKIVDYINGYNTVRRILVIPFAVIAIGPQTAVFNLVGFSLSGVRSNMSEFSVSKSDQPIPMLRMVGPPLRYISVGDAITLSAIAINSACAGDVLRADQGQLSFVWTMRPADFITIDPVSSITPSLIVPPFTLIYTTTYVFTCTATNVALMTLTNSVSVTVIVQSSPLSIMIEGGTTQFVSPLFPIRLAVNVIDIDHHTKIHYQYNWSCAMKQVSTNASVGLTAPTPCYNLLTNDNIKLISLTTITSSDDDAFVSCPSTLAPSVINAQYSINSTNTSYMSVSPSGIATSSVLMFPPRSLSMGNYMFTLVASQVGAIANKKSVTANIRVAITPSSIVPLVSLYASTLLVNPSDPLTIQATAMCTSTTICSPSISVSYMWSVNGGSFPSFANLLYVPSGWTSSTLSINTLSSLSGIPIAHSNVRHSTFPASGALKFRCTVTLASGAMGMAEVDVVVTSPPSGGSFTVVSAGTSSTGAPQFTASATGWGTNVVSTPTTLMGVTSKPMVGNNLFYRFYSSAPDGSLWPFGTAIGNSTDTDQIPTVSSSQAVTMWLRVSDATGAYAYTSLTTTVASQSLTSVGQSIQDSTLLSSFVTYGNTAGVDTIASFILKQSTLDAVNVCNVVVSLMTAAGTVGTSLTPNVLMNPLATFAYSYWSSYAIALSKLMSVTGFANNNNALRCLSSFSATTQNMLITSSYSTLITFSANRLWKMVNTLVQLTQYGPPSPATMRACNTIANAACFTPLGYLIAQSNMDALLSLCANLTYYVIAIVPTVCVTSASPGACGGEKQNMLGDAYATIVTLLSLRQNSLQAPSFALPVAITVPIMQAASSGVFTPTLTAAATSMSMKLAGQSLLLSVSNPSMLDHRLSLSSDNSTNGNATSGSTGASVPATPIDVIYSPSNPSAATFSSAGYAHDDRAIPIIAGNIGLMVTLLDDLSLVNLLVLSLFTLFDSYSSNVQLFVANSTVAFADCHVPSFIRTDWSANNVTFVFDVDGTTVYFAPFVPPSTMTTNLSPASAASSISDDADVDPAIAVTSMPCMPTSSSSTMLPPILGIMINYRAVYIITSPYSVAMIQGGWMILSGVIIVNKTSTATQQPLPLPYFGTSSSVTISIRTDGTACQSTCAACGWSWCSRCNSKTMNCAPQCLILDPMTQIWRNDSTIVQSSSVRYFPPVNIGTKTLIVMSTPRWIVDCVINAVVAVTVAVFTGPPPPINATIVLPPKRNVTKSSSSSSSSTARRQHSSSSSSSSSTGVARSLGIINVTVLCGSMSFGLDLASVGGVTKFNSSLLSQFSEASTIPKGLISVLAIASCSICVTLCILPYYPAPSSSTVQPSSVRSTTSSMMRSTSKILKLLFNRMSDAPHSPSSLYRDKYPSFESEHLSLPSHERSSNPTVIVNYAAIIALLANVDAHITDHDESAWWSYPILKHVAALSFSYTTWQQCFDGGPIVPTCAIAAIPPLPSPPADTDWSSWAGIIFVCVFVLACIISGILYYRHRQRKIAYRLFIAQSDFAALEASQDPTRGMDEFGQPLMRDQQSFTMMLNTGRGGTGMPGHMRAAAPEFAAIVDIRHNVTHPPADHPYIHPSFQTIFKEEDEPHAAMREHMGLGVGLDMDHGDGMYASAKAYNSKARRSKGKVLTASLQTKTVSPTRRQDQVEMARRHERHVHKDQHDDQQLNPQTDWKSSKSKHHRRSTSGPQQWQRMRDPSNPETLSMSLGMHTSSIPHSSFSTTGHPLIRRSPFNESIPHDAMQPSIDSAAAAARRIEHDRMIVAARAKPRLPSFNKGRHPSQTKTMHTIGSTNEKSVKSSTPPSTRPATPSKGSRGGAYRDSIMTPSRDASSQHDDNAVNRDSGIDANARSIEMIRRIENPTPSMHRDTSRIDQGERLYYGNDDDDDASDNDDGDDDTDDKDRDDYKYQHAYDDNRFDNVNRAETPMSIHASHSASRSMTPTTASSAKVDVITSSSSSLLSSHNAAPLPRSSSSSHRRARSSQSSVPSTPSHQTASLLSAASSLSSSILLRSTPLPSLSSYSIHPPIMSSHSSHQLSTSSVPSSSSSSAAPPSPSMSLSSLSYSSSLSSFDTRHGDARSKKAKQARMKQLQKWNNQ